MHQPYVSPALSQIKFVVKFLDKNGTKTWTSVNLVNFVCKMITCSKFVHNPWLIIWIIELITSHRIYVGQCATEAVCSVSGFPAVGKNLTCWFNFRTPECLLVPYFRNRKKICLYRQFNEKLVAYLAFEQQRF